MEQFSYECVLSNEGNTRSLIHPFDGSMRPVVRLMLAGLLVLRAALEEARKEGVRAGAMRGARGFGLVFARLSNGAFFLNDISADRLHTNDHDALACVVLANHLFYPRKVEKDEIGRNTSLSLLRRGMITPGQAAELAGVSRQLVAYWLKHAGIDWRRAWERRQASMWRHEIAALNGKVMRSPTKKELRKRGLRAKSTWDAAKAI